jgi:hypothetical protein
VDFSAAVANTLWILLQVPQLYAVDFSAGIAIQLNYAP